MFSRLCKLECVQNMEVWLKVGGEIESNTLVKWHSAWELRSFIKKYLLSASCGIRGHNSTSCRILGRVECVLPE